MHVLSRAVVSAKSKQQNPLESLFPVQVPTPGLGWPWNLHFNRYPCDSEVGVPGLYLEVPTSAGSHEEPWTYRIKPKLPATKMFNFDEVQFIFFFLWLLVVLVTKL